MTRAAIGMAALCLAAAAISSTASGADADRGARTMGVNAALVLADRPPALLSEFGFFDPATGRPTSGLIGYDLQSPLFSDFAVKDRLIFVPPGAQMQVDDGGRIVFPVGSAIIKTFSFTRPDGTRRVVETRLLLHQAGGWVALPYIWRDDGSDADLRLAGGRIAMTAQVGTRTLSFSYAVPNRNQCRTCHQRSEALVPIGPRLRNIKDMWGGDGGPYFAGTVPPGSLNMVMPRWDSAAVALDQRARAYLDINCAHCHNPAGSASNSGLFLEYERPMGMVTGLWKRPVAAGRGSGGLDFAIEPGRPDRSFMLYRMHSTDPGIAMPELGRGLVHDEGVALIEQWIAAMPAGTPPVAGQ